MNYPFLVVGVNAITIDRCGFPCQQRSQKETVSNNRTEEENLVDFLHNPLFTMSSFMSWQQGRQFALRIARMRRQYGSPRSSNTTVTALAALSVAALTLSSSTSSYQQEEEESKRQETKPNSSSNTLTSLLLSTTAAALPLPQRTYCDGWLSYITGGGRGGKSIETKKAATNNPQNPQPPTRRNSLQNLRLAAEKGDLEARYDVDWRQPIGEGNFGLVYKARDRKTGEWVALKEIPQTAENDEAFQREIDAFLYLRQAGGHSNICALQANYEKNGYSYLVLDYIEGGEMCKF